MGMMLPKSKRRVGQGTTLEGQLLVAMPVMTDKRFARSVIYMCAHSKEGAMGLIINHRAGHITFPDLLERLGITPRGAASIPLRPVSSTAKSIPADPSKPAAASFSTPPTITPPTAHSRLPAASV